MKIFDRRVGVRLTLTEKLLNQKLKIARQTGYLEAETDEGPRKSDIARVVESYFNLPNEYSSRIILTDSNFLFTNKTYAIATIANMSVRTVLAADFKRQNKNIEYIDLMINEGASVACA